MATLIFGVVSVDFTILAGFNGATTARGARAGYLPGAPRHRC